MHIANLTYHALTRETYLVPTNVFSIFVTILTLIHTMLVVVSSWLLAVEDPGMPLLLPEHKSAACSDVRSHTLMAIQQFKQK